MISELPARETTHAEIERIKKTMERIREEGVKYASAMEVGLGKQGWGPVARVLQT